MKILKYKERDLFEDCAGGMLQILEVNENPPAGEEGLIYKSNIALDDKYLWVSEEFIDQNFKQFKVDKTYSEALSVLKSKVSSKLLLNILRTNPPTLEQIMDIYSYVKHGVDYSDIIDWYESKKGRKMRYKVGDRFKDPEGHVREITRVVKHELPFNAYDFNSPSGSFGFCRLSESYIDEYFTLIEDSVE